MIKFLVRWSFSGRDNKSNFVGIELPDLKQTHCRYLTACGSLVPDSDAASDALQLIAQAQDGLTAYFQSNSKERIYIRLMASEVSDNNDGFHFHVDLVISDAFRKGSKPLINARIAEIRSLTSSLQGSRIDVDVRFGSKIPEEEVGGFVGYLSKFGSEIKARVVAAEISFEKEKEVGISELSWRFSESALYVAVELAPISTTLDQEYLSRLLRAAENVLRYIALGDKEDAREKSL